MPRRVGQPCCCVHVTAATRVLSLSPPFQVIFGHWRRSDSSPLQWTSLQCILTFWGANRGTVRAWLDILENYIEQSCQSGISCVVSITQHSVYNLSFSLFPFPEDSHSLPCVNAHMGMCACQRVHQFWFQCQRVSCVCAGLWPAYMFPWDMARQLLLWHENIKSETQLHAHKKGGQRGPGNTVNRRALMVFKYRLGMGFWNAKIAQKAHGAL